LGLNVAKWFWIILAIGVIAMTGGVVAVGLEGIIEKMADAIQAYEGWSEGTRSYRNNNPGNLKYAGQSGSTGADADGFAIFPDYDTGRTALLNQLRIAFTGLSHVYSPSDTFYSFFDKYNASGSNSADYAAYVASALGVDPNSTLGSLIV
jgi:hypothetical protein